MRKLALAAVIALGIVLGFAARAEADPVKLTVATLAPMQSPWGRVFEAWRKGVKQTSNDKLELQFFYGNQQGDEVAMVGKMRTRQLDGAAITATGLAQIDRNPLAMEMPGLFPDWATLDKVREALKPGFDASFAKQGFVILGWGDVGVPRFMTKGFQAVSPSDLAHKRCFFLPGDPIAPTLFEQIGDVTPQMLTVPEILPALVAGTVDVVDGPPLASEQLQWSPRLDNISLMPTRFEIGALVFTSSKVNGLPADLRAILLTSGAGAAAALTGSIRKLDDEAYARALKRMTPYQPKVEQWQALFKHTREKLRTQSTFDAKVFEVVSPSTKKP